MEFEVLDQKAPKVLEDYVITKRIETALEEFLECVLDAEKASRKAFAAIGAYGSGKSYFLIFSSLIVEALINPSLFIVMQRKLKREGKKKLLEILAKLKKRKIRLLPVRIDLKHESSTEHLHTILILKLRESVKKYLDIELPVPYEYDEILKTLKKLEIEPKDPGDLDRFKKALKEYNYDELKVMMEQRVPDGIRIYKEAWKIAFYQPPEIPSPPIPVIFSQTIDFLKRNDFHGIAFFVDELQKFLEGREEILVENDFLRLEAMSEESRGRSIFLLVSLISRGIAHKKPEIPKSYEKMLGRFETFDLTLEELDQIIASRLEFKQKNLLFKKLEKNEAISLLNKDNQGLLSKLYPLNPMTFYLLKDAANLRAETRSATKFLWDSYKKIENEPFVQSDTKPTLITPDFLYEYFKEDLQREKPDIVDEVVNLLNLVKTQTEDKITKFAGVSSVLERSLGDDDIVQAFLVEKTVAERTLEGIRGKRTIFVPREEGKYIISPVLGETKSTILELRKKVTAPLERMTTTLNENNKEIKKRTIAGAEREIEILFALIDKAEKYLEKKSDKEMRVLVVIPQDKLNEEDIRDLGDIASENDLLVLVRKRDADLEILRDYFAAIDGVKQKDLTEKQIEIYLENGKLHLKNLFKADNISVFYSGAKIIKHADFISAKDLKVNEAFLDEVLRPAFRRLYPRFSELKIAGEVKKTFTNKILTYFIYELQMDIDEKTETIAQYVKNIVEPMGLAERTNDKYRLVLPTREAEKKIIDEMLTKIKETPESCRLYSLLTRSPNGFPDPIIELYLGTLIALKKIVIKDPDKNLVDFDNFTAEEFEQEIHNIIHKSKKEEDYYLISTEPFPEDTWIVVREFLKEIVKRPVKILDAGQIRQDQCDEVVDIMKESLYSHLATLRTIADFLEKYQEKLRRIRTTLAEGERR